MTAATLPSAEALLSALEPHARVRRLASGLRLLDLQEPHALDEPTLKLAADTLRLVPPCFHGSRCGRAGLALVDRFRFLDGVLVVVGARQPDLRGWVAYTMLRVHRRPVLWLHAAAAEPGPGGRGPVRRAVRYAVVREWLRHRCPRRCYVAGLARQAQLSDLRSLVPPGVGPWLPGDAATATPADLGHLGEALGRWVINDRSHYGLASQARFDAEALVVRDAWSREPCDDERGEAAEPLGHHDAALMVVRVSPGVGLRLRRASR